MNKCSSAVVRQISNGFVVVIYIPGNDTLNPPVGPTEKETYYPDIATATAAIAAAI